jgi:hypothetical protein
MLVESNRGARGTRDNIGVYGIGWHTKVCREVQTIEKGLYSSNKQGNIRRRREVYVRPLNLKMFMWR